MIAGWGFRFSMVALAVGIGIAGPQALSVAAADDSESSSPTAGAAPDRDRRSSADRAVRLTGDAGTTTAPGSVGGLRRLPGVQPRRPERMAEKNQLPAPAKTPGAPAPETDSAVEAPATVREPVRIDIEVTVNQPAAAAPTADLPQPITAEPAVLSVASDLIATADADIGHSVGEDPAAPAVTPLGWTLLAAARRELGASPTRVQVGAGALATPTGAAGSGLFANPITVAPVVPQFTDGIINGYVTATDANGLPLFYSLVSPPTEGGKVALNGDIGRFAYLPDLAVLNAGGTESFGVLVSERTPFVAALEGLIDLSDARAIIRGIVASLQQMPIVNLLLEPLIGRATMQQITLVNSALVPSPADTPVAYTTKIVSFDGTLISTNYFPAAGLQSGQTAPAVFTTAGLSSPGQTDPYAQWDSSILFAPLVLGVAPLREAGYSVVTWDSRGKAASGGVLELGAPEFEGRDFRAIVDYYAALDVIAADETGDPLIGTIGGSYGGGMQLVNAALDPRIDAIVPGIAWNTLTGSLYPTQTFSTVWGALLPALLLSAGARINPQIYIAALSGVLLGTIPAFSEALLARTGPGEGAADITAPTLLIQGIPDTTFPLEEAVINARLIDGAGTPVKMIWYCGGHGVCLNPQNPDHDELILGATLSWLDRYVRNETLPAELPTFQWVDQFGVPWGSDLMPFDPGFHGRPLTVTGAGGVMPILSVLGGGGPSLVSLPLSLLATGPAINAVNVSITAPSAVQIVGAPEVTFTYAGVGTASHLYAQIVDDKTGLVLSNGATPIPVRLNGSSHTVTVSLADVAHNLATGESVTLQLSNAALPFYDFLSVGVVGISDVRLSLPTVADGVAMSLRPVSA